MAVLGSSAQPTTYEEGFGLNSVNMIAQTLTLPAGGPWRIYQLGGWLGGWNETCIARLCLYTSGGGLVRQSSDISVASQGAIGLGNTIQKTAVISDYVVNGGTTVYVGWWRDPDTNHQNGYTGSGTHVHDTQGQSPESFGAWSSHGGGIGCFLYYDAANEVPTAPSLVSPANGAILNDTTPTLDWTHNDPDGDPQAKFEVQYDNNSAFSSPTLVAQTTSATSYTMPDQGRGNIRYWRVRTADAAGFGPWSATRWFRTAALPTNAVTSPVADKVAPLYYTAGSDTTPKFRVGWSFACSDGGTQSSAIIRVYDAAGTTLLHTHNHSGSAKTADLSAYAPTNGTKYQISVQTTCSHAAQGVESAKVRCQPRWGRSAYFADLGSVPLSLSATVDSTPNSGQVIMEYASQATAPAAEPTDWKATLSEVTKQRYVWHRVTLIPQAGVTTPVSPALNSVLLSYSAQALVPNDWTLPGGLTEYVDQGTFVYGTQSLHFVGNGSNVREATQIREVTPDTDYVISGRMKTQGDPPASIQVLTADGSEVLASVAATADADWRRWTAGPFNTGGNTQVMVKCRAGSTLNAHAWFDALKLEASRVVTAWTPGMLGHAVVVDAGGIQIDAAQGGLLRLRGSDGVSQASLAANGLVGAIVPVEPSPALKYGWTWYKVATTVAVGADTDTDVDSAFRVTYPGNPAMAGKKVIIRAWIDAGYTFSVANTETGLALFASVVPNDHNSTRLRWQRQRYPATASVQQSQHLSHVARWNAEQVVEFKAMCRAAVAGSFLFYNATTAIYVSQIGYEVLGYSAT